MIKVKIVAYPDADQEMFNSRKESFLEFFSAIKSHIQFVEKDPDAILIISGGSESEVKKFAKKGKNYIIVSCEENNATASALEIIAYFNQNSISGVLLTSWEDAREYLINYLEVKDAIKNLRGKKLGLIGKVSDWLIASDVNRDNLLEKTGIEIKQVNWDKLLPLNEAKPDTGFMQDFNDYDETEISNAAKIHHVLDDYVKREKPDAITVECFSIIYTKKVSACLSLARFNDLGIPAGCEGDITSAVGLMLVKEVCDLMPWMANIAGLNKESTLLAHCTIPTKLVNEYKITTHYETGLATAIQGKYAYDDITLFRMDNMLTKAFVTTGVVLNRPEYDTACRTQIEVKLEEEGFIKLKNNPLGNHHIVIPGNQKDKLIMTCNILGLELV